MKNSIRQASKTTLFSNFGWLTVSHGLNLILPLIIYPYLIRVIGLESFGKVMFALMTVMYFSNFIDFGFSLSGIRAVSINRSNKKILARIFSDTFYTKFILLIFGLFVFQVLIAMVPKMAENSLLFSASFSVAIGQWLLPLWFLQGLEKMKTVAFLNILSKLLFLIMVFVIIKKPEDYEIVNLLLGISQIALGIAGLLLVTIQYKLPLLRPSLNSIRSQIRHNYLLFISSFSSYVSSNSSLVILGFVADPLSTGYYAIVERILVISKAPAVLLYQTVYPEFCTKALSSMENLLKFSSKVNRWVYIIFIPVTLIIWIFPNEIIAVFAGKSLEDPIILLYIISVIPLIVALNIPPTQALLAYKLDRPYAFITIFGAALNVLLTTLLASYFLAVGAAISALITEICVTTLIFITISTKLENYAPFRVLNWK